jgi:hypothetical protein
MITVLYELICHSIGYFNSFCISQELEGGILDGDVVLENRFALIITSYRI